MRTVCATRYVMPFREGGSMPALVEADDLGLYVLKFRGAGQGVLALVAELIAGELARAICLPVPELVLVDVDDALGRNEPDEEIRDLLRASTGLNVGVDYLPGSLMFDPAARCTAPPDLASRTVWFDSYVLNVDRTPRNPNLLLWHRALYLIDHGAALYFHHDWESRSRLAVSRFAAIRDHVLLPWASDLQEADAFFRRTIDLDLLSDAVSHVPDDWLQDGRSKEGYVQFFHQRLKASDGFMEEAIRARAALL